MGVNIGAGLVEAEAGALLPALVLPPFPTNAGFIAAVGKGRGPTRGETAGETNGDEDVAEPKLPSGASERKPITAADEAVVVDVVGFGELEVIGASVWDCVCNCAYACVGELLADAAGETDADTETETEALTYSESAAGLAERCLRRAPCPSACIPPAPGDVGERGVVGLRGTSELRAGKPEGTVS